MQTSEPGRRPEIDSGALQNLKINQTRVLNDSREQGRLAHSSFALNQNRQDTGFRTENALEGLL